MKKRLKHQDFKINDKKQFSMKKHVTYIDFAIISIFKKICIMETMFYF